MIDRERIEQPLADMLIAVSVRDTGAVLITMNEKDFKRIRDVYDLKYGSSRNRAGTCKQVNRNVESKAGICRNKAQNTQSVAVSPFALLARLD